MTIYLQQKGESKVFHKRANVLGGTYPLASAWGKRARSREPGPGLAEAETAGHRLVVLAGVGKTRLGAAARNADHRSLARALYVVHLAALLHLRPLNPHTPCP